MEDEDEIEVLNSPPLLNLSMFQFENDDSKNKPVRAISKFRKKSKFFELEEIK